MKEFCDIIHYCGRKVVIFVQITTIKVEMKADKKVEMKVEKK